jgi:hypothetical protein
MVVEGIRTDKTTYVLGENVNVSLNGRCGIGMNYFAIDILVSTDNQQTWTKVLHWFEIMGCLSPTWSDTWVRDVGNFNAPSIIGDMYVGAAHAFGTGAGQIIVSTKVNIRQPFPPNKGELGVTTSPGGAFVDLNGVQQASTTPFRAIIDAGLYDVRIRKEGYVTVQDVAIVNSGSVTELNYTLTPGGDGLEGLIKYLPWVALAGGIVVAAKIGSDVIAAKRRGEKRG